jgi:hypothetical protein
MPRTQQTCVPINRQVTMKHFAPCNGELKRDQTNPDELVKVQYNAACHTVIFRVYTNFIFAAYTYNLVRP